MQHYPSERIASSLSLSQSWFEYFHFRLLPSHFSLHFLLTPSSPAFYLLFSPCISTSFHMSRLFISKYFPIDATYLAQFLASISKRVILINILFSSPYGNTICVHATSARPVLFYCHLELTEPVSSSTFLSFLFHRVTRILKSAIT